MRSAIILRLLYLPSFPLSYEERGSDAERDHPKAVIPPSFPLSYEERGKEGGELKSWHDKMRFRKKRPSKYRARRGSRGVPNGASRRVTRCLF